MNIEQLKTIFETALKGLGVADPKVIFERPGELSHGDYATNVAMAYAKQLGKNPKALAEEIVAALSKSDLGMKKELLPFSSDPHVIADAPLSKLGETGARGWGEVEYFYLNLDYQLIFCYITNNANDIRIYIK